LVKQKTRKLKDALLPGIFLLSLGIGNIAVGWYKAEQYEQVLIELSDTRSPPLINASPLRRIQLANKTLQRSYQRQVKSQARLDFYRLVTYGGEIFVCISLLVIVYAFVRQNLS
jgi:hypothetical protein